MTSLDMRKACDEALKYKTASVCLPPHFVAAARHYGGEKLVICTVIGFPNGYNTTRAKCDETKDAILNGANELDMVVNLCMLKDRYFEGIVEEINSLKAICGGRILKVIIETCLLS